MRELMRLVCIRTFALTTMVLFGTEGVSRCENASLPSSPAQPAGSAAAKKTAPLFVNATDYPDLQAAVDAVAFKGGTVYLPPGEYKLTKPLNLADRYNSGDKTRFITLQGSGMLTTTISGDFPGNVIVDLTHSGYMTLRDLTITGHAKCMVLCARKNNEGGGNHLFENVALKGSDCTVAVALMASECDRFYNCQITVEKPEAVGVLFSARNDYAIKSPYSEAGGGSNTELRFYGCIIHSFGQNSVGLKIQGSANDVSIFGGYFCNRGLASIYLDGATGNVGDVLIDGVRIEGAGGLYCLYAKGAVRNVTMEGCTFASGGEVIRYDSATFKNTAAEGWRIAHCSLALQGEISTDKLGSSTAELYRSPDGERAIFRMEKLLNSRFENNWIRAYQASSGAVTTANAPTENAAQLPFTRRVQWYVPRTLICSGEAKGNTFTVGNSDEVQLRGPSYGNRLEALDDGGVRRTYLGAGNGADLINLTPMDVTKIRTPHVGDLAIDSGNLHRDGKLRLVYFDGKTWVSSVGDAAR